MRKSVQEGYYATSSEIEEMFVACDVHRQEVDYIKRLTNDNPNVILGIYRIHSKDLDIFLRDLGGRINEKEIICIPISRFLVGA